MITRWFGRRPRLWGASLGAGVLGAALLSRRFWRKPSPRRQIPEAISPAIFATRMAGTSRGELVYHESGQGDPLLFVHGIYVGASSFEWSKVYPHFADGWHVLAPDLVGFGESAQPQGVMTAFDHVQTLAELVRMKTMGDRVTIVASGLGAGFSVALAWRHPELVRRLILWMPSGGSADAPDAVRVYVRVPWLIPVLFKNSLFYRRYLSKNAQLRHWLKAFAYADPDKVTDEVVDVLTDCASQLGAERAIFQWFSRRFDLDLERTLAGLTQPVSLLWGEQAVAPALEWAYWFQPLPRRCHLTVIPGLGALGPLENGSLLTEVLASELNPGLRVYRAG